MKNLLIISLRVICCVILTSCTSLLAFFGEVIMAALHKGKNLNLQFWLDSWFMVVVGFFLIISICTLLFVHRKKKYSILEAPNSYIKRPAIGDICIIGLMCLIGLIPIYLMFHIG